jgi:predicted DNA-binding transcriptional regulator AlpA
LGGKFLPKNCVYVFSPMSKELLPNAPSGETAFIDEKELLNRIPVSRRTLFSWRATGKIPSVHLGGRRVLFHWPSVEAALLRMQKGGVH